jgi:Ca2+-binding EF-hand superfamily protein
MSDLVAFISGGVAMVVKKFSIMAVLVVTGLLCSSPAYAADKDDFDANGDGRVTFEEVMKRVESSTRKTFDALDRNKDGALSDEDFDGVRDQMKEMEDWLEELIKPFLDEDEEKEIVT